jgi:hypothetical protein
MAGGRVSLVAVAVLAVACGLEANSSMEDLAAAVEATSAVAATAEKAPTGQLLEVRVAAREAAADRASATEKRRRARVVAELQAVR